MTKQELKDWNELVNHAYVKLENAEDKDLRAIVAADVYMRQLERKVQKRRVAAILQNRLQGY